MQRDDRLYRFLRFVVAWAMGILIFSHRSMGEDTSTEILAKVQEKYDKIIDATISFGQKVKFNLSKAEYTSNGSLLMKKPDHYRIETDDRTFVTDGKTVWSYSPTNKQVLVDTYKEDERSFSPERFLLNAPKDFYAVILGSEKYRGQNVIVLKLTPKDDRSATKSMKLWVDNKEWILWKVEVVDKTDNVTLYTVTEFRANTNLSDSTFTFVPPPGVEVVDLR